jgi:hypothetical protein
LSVLVSRASGEGHSLPDRLREFQAPFKKSRIYLLSEGKVHEPSRMAERGLGFR